MEAGLLKVIQELRAETQAVRELQVRAQLQAAEAEKHAKAREKQLSKKIAMLKLEGRKGIEAIQQKQHLQQQFFRKSDTRGTCGR